MKTKPLLALAIVLSLFVAIPLIAPPQTANAQGSPDITYDFTIDQQGFDYFDSTRALYVAGVGWTETIDRPDRISIVLTGVTLSNVVRVRAYYDTCTGITDVGLLNDQYGNSCGSGYAEFVPIVPATTYMDVDTIVGSGSHVLYKIEIWTSGPTPTPTFTPTVGPTVTPTVYPDAYSHRICLLMADRAEFRSGWTFTGSAAFAYTSPNHFLQLPPGGEAKLVMGLNPAKLYGVTVLLRAVQTGDNGTITIKIGQSAAYSIPIESHTDLRGFAAAPISYVPDASGGFTVDVSRPSTTSGDVVVEYLCIQQKTGSETGDNVGGTGAETDRCTTCQAPDWFGDLGGIINWILCQLKNLWSCYIAQFLIYIMNGIMKIASFALDIFVAFVDGFNAMVAWAVNLVISIGRFFSGTSQNVGTQASNAMHTSGIANALNVTASGVRDLPTMILNMGAGLLHQVNDAILTSTSLIQIILRLITVAFSAIFFALFGLFPLLLSALADGFNTTGRLTSLTLTCTSPSSLLYYPCMGFYVLDNTILSGPAKYLIPIAMGLWAVDTFAWAFNRIKEELSK